MMRQVQRRLLMRAVRRFQSSAFAMVSGSSGTIAFNGSNVVFTPSQFFNGMSFATYIVQDSGAGNPTSIGTISFIVTEINDPPVPTAARRNALSEVPIYIDLEAELTQASRGGSFDEASQSVRISRVIPLPFETRGSVFVNAQRTIRYVPPPGFKGLDVFDYEVIDNGTTNGQSDPKTGISFVEVNVESFNSITIDLGNLGTKGVTIFGANGGDLSGSDVSDAGDVNGDGFNDFLIGAYRSDGPNKLKPDAGESYLIFGGPSLPSSIDLRSLGSLGVKFLGAVAGDLNGVRVSSAGDINGDGFDDFLLGAAGSNGPSNQRTDAGELFLFLVVLIYHQPSILRM